MQYIVHAINTSIMKPYILHVKLLLWFTPFVASMSKTQFKRVCMHFLQMKVYSSAVWQFFWLCCCKEIGCSTKRRTICVVILDEREYNLIQRKTEQRDPSKHHRKCKFYYMISRKHYPNLWVKSFDNLKYHLVSTTERKRDPCLVRSNLLPHASMAWKEWFEAEFVLSICEINVSMSLDCFDCYWSRWGQ